jgi:hypothetical protein
MDFIVNKSQQIAVTADNPDEAVKKVLNGEGNPVSTNYSAQPRPQPPVAAGTFVPAPVQPKAA